MKKTLLSFAVLMSTTAAHAFTPVTGGEWTGNLDFNGSISNEIPVWEFEITTEAQDLATDMDAIFVDGVDDGSHVTWTFDQWNETVILMGQMMDIVSQGGPGLSPAFYFGPDEVQITGGENDPTPMSLEVAGDDGEVGQIDMELFTGWAFGSIDPNTGDPGIAYPANQPSAEHLYLPQLLAHPKRTDASWAGETPYATLTSYLPSVLSDDQVTEILAVQGVASKEVALVFPNTDVPETWTATLPIKVVIN